MTKDATVAARVDADVKEGAGEVFERIGVPMSLGIELFLRQVAQTGRLPFALSGQDGLDPARQERERDFWRVYMQWNFDVWPRFDGADAELAARERYGYDGRFPGDAVKRLIDAFEAQEAVSDGDAASAETVSRELSSAARRDLYELSRLLGDAKELIYWALGMEKVFVPSLSGTYAAEADGWRLEHLAAHARDLSGSPEELDDDELMNLFDEWVMESGLDAKTESLLAIAAENAADFEDVRRLLIAANALEDFEDYVEECGREARQMPEG